MDATVYISEYCRQSIYDRNNTSGIIIPYGADTKLISQTHDYRILRERHDIDDKDTVYDLEQFAKKLDAWLELMETSDIIYRNNGFYCLQPLAVHFRNDKNGIIRSLLNESFYWMKTLDEQTLSNI